MNLERQRLAEAIFKEALSVAGSAREALLQSRCAADTELLGEVRSLLQFAGGDDADGPLDRSAPVMMGIPDTPDAQLLKPGRRVGAYEIVEPLGFGGMGVVYRAEQLRPRRSVALKVIRPGLATPTVLKRFEYECELLGRLDHPGIARIIEAGTAETDFGILPFFAMELVDGRPLTKHFAETGGTVRDKLTMITRIAEAVEHAHQRGVIHRDLKPGNILVERDGSPKILDFGVARATGGREAEQRLTLLRTGDRQLVGTLAYMSPEQVSGDARDVDTRSDVYSLGVVAFELLTGRLPHPVESRPLPDAVRMIRDDDPLRLSEVDPALRGDLDTILTKVLAKDPAQRYQSAAEFASDLRRYLDDAPIFARPPSAAYQLKKFASRHRAMVGAAAAAVVCLAAGLAVSLYLWRDAELARAAAETERGKAEGARNLAQDAQRAAEAEAERQRTLVAFYHDRILTQAFWSGPSTAIVDALKTAVEPQSMRFRGDSLNEARLLYSAAQVFTPCHQLARSFNCLDRALKLLETLSTAPPQEVFEIRMFLVQQMARQGDAKLALEINAANRDLAARCPNPDAVLRSAQMGDGIANWYMGRYDRASELLTEYRNFARNVPDARPMVTFVPTNRLAPMLAEMGRIDEAQALWDEMVERQDRFTGPNSEMAQFHDYAAIMYEQLEDWPRAVRERRKHLVCVSRFTQASAKTTVQSQTTLIRDLLKEASAESIREALDVSEHQLTDARKLIRANPDAACDAFACRLAALAASGRTAEFESLKPEAEALADDVALLPYEIIEIRLELARADLRAGNAMEAARTAATEHERRVRVKGRTFPQTLEALRLRLLALAQAGKADDARAVGDREIEARRAEAGLEDFHSIALIEEVASASLARGDLEAAERQMTLAFQLSERVTGWWSKRSLGLRVALAEIRARSGRTDAARALLDDGVTRCRQEFGAGDHPRTRIVLRAIEHLDPKPRADR